MPFFLYSVNTSDSNRREYTRADGLAAHVMRHMLKRNPHPDKPGEISLAGTTSPFRTVLADAGSAKWHATDEDILYLLGVERPAEHRILIDLKPKGDKNVSLYRLRDVWGCTKNGWTPMALRLEGLLVDEPQDNPKQFKQIFCAPLETKDFVYEFLYLNDTTENGGKWTWGLVGRVNGALLWPDTLRYFADAINRQLIEDSLEPLCL